MSLALEADVWQPDAQPPGRHKTQRWDDLSLARSETIWWMRVARNLAAAFTVLSLIAAAVLMLNSTSMTFCAGNDCRTVDCGSPAFPKALNDFERPDDAANCAGATSASASLYSVVLAGLGLGVVAVTSRGISAGGSHKAAEIERVRLSG